MRMVMFIGAALVLAGAVPAMAQTAAQTPGRVVGSTVRTTGT